MSIKPIFITKSSQDGIDKKVKKILKVVCMSDTHELLGDLIESSEIPDG